MMMEETNRPGPTVLLTGGTGFVGRYVTRALAERGCRIRLLHRTESPPDDIGVDVEFVRGDILDPDSLDAVRGADAVVHLVGIIEEVPRKAITFERIHVEGTRNIVAAAKRAGVSTFVHMSANGASDSGSTAYLRTKWNAEEIVREAGFDAWTVFRPSVIFGRPGPGCPEFATQLVDTLIRPFPVWPVFGDGLYALQPIAVEDVADAFAAAVVDSRFHGRTYCVAGAERLSYLNVLEVLAQAAGVRSRPKLHAPLWLVRPLVNLLSPTGLLPITPEQLEMLVGSNTCDASEFLLDFATDPVPFTASNLDYLRSR